MNKLPARLLIITLFVLGLLRVPVSLAFAAPGITLNPTDVTVAQNAQFSLEVRINAESTNVMGADATINYAGADLEFVSASSGNYFPVFASANDPAGILELHSYTLSSLETHTGAGTLATVVFKAKKGAGSSNISFSCSGNGHDTDIRTTEGTNILNCANVNHTGVAYTGAASTTNSPTATATQPPATGTTSPGATHSPSPSPTQPPVGGNGNTAPSCASIYSDISSAVGTPLSVTLTCSGLDPDGYINAAEFSFGDGTKQTVEKNAGSPGSIATTHTYTTIGTLGISCRVRDNNAVWSSIPENCNKVITIKPGSNTAGTPTPTYKMLGNALTPTPTPMVVSIVADTPLPTESPSPEPTLYPDNGTGTTEGGVNRVWWIIAGIAAVILAFLLLRRREPKNPQHPPMQQPPVQPPPAQMPPVA
jgi:hypothetical protein